MRLTTFIAGAALMAICAGPAAAASKTVAAPSKPIPYSQLDAYMKASAKERASRDWWADTAVATAPVGAPADVSDTTPEPVTPDATATSPMTVNPAPRAGGEAVTPTPSADTSPATTPAAPPSQTGEGEEGEATADPAATPAQ